MPQDARGRGLRIAPPRGPPLGSPDLPEAHVIRPQRRHFGAPDEEGKSGGKEGKEPGERWARTRARARPVSWPAKGGSRKQQPPPDRRYRAPGPPLCPQVAPPPAMCVLPSGLYRRQLPFQRGDTAQGPPHALSSASSSSALRRPQQGQRRPRACPAAGGGGEIAALRILSTSLVCRRACKAFLASFPPADVKPLRPAAIKLTTVSSPHLLITFLRPHRPSPAANSWYRKS